MTLNRRTLGLDILLTDDQLSVDLGINFRNRIWGQDFGLIQKILHDRQVDGLPVKRLLINIARCEWVDPLPVLSLLISMHEFYKAGGICKLVVPSFKENHKEVPRETDKVIRFLYEEDFLKRFSECCVIVDEDDEEISNPALLLNSGLEKYGKIRSSLYYTNSSLLPAEVLDTKRIFADDLDLVDKWVDERVKLISARISDKIPSYSQNSIAHKVSVVLVELIQNIVKHAYTITSKSFAGVYVRFRNGLNNNSLSVTDRRRLERALRDESRSCPRLEREYLDFRKGCVEIFVIDSGGGFTNSLKELFTTPPKYPFREAYSMVFKDGRRKGTHYGSSTYSGGLFFIGEMLQSSQDYLCGRDENEWVGGVLPLYGLSNAYEPIVGIDHQIQGLCWIVRLSWKHENETGQKFWSSWKGTAKTNPVYKALENKQNLGMATKYVVHDNRFDLHEIGGVIERSIKERSDENVILLPGANQTKFGIWKVIDQLARPLDKSSDRCLFIADIPEFEKLLYTYTLNRIQIPAGAQGTHWVNKFSRIIMITRRLGVCVLKRLQYTFEMVDTEESQEYVKSGGLQFDVRRNLAHFIELLRSYDSLLFWTNIRLNNKQKNFFVNSIVQWNNELKHINGYLDFSQAATDAMSLNIFKIALERSVGLFGDSYGPLAKACHFNNIDVLTKKLADEANSTLFNTLQYPSNHEVYLGSVFVSGISAKDAMFYIDQPQHGHEVINVHYFLHGTSETQVPHLLSWPSHEWINKTFGEPKADYERVGRTHVIAKHGYKSFTVPRFNELTGDSEYYRNPRETYKDWQNEKNQIISFGHYEFEGKHDLFKVNIIKLLDESFLFQNELSKFLLSEFFYALSGRSVDQLTEKGKRYWDFIERRLLELKKLQLPRVALIAYPNNSNSAYVIDRIKEFLQPQLASRIFALMPVNKERVGSSLLISPLVFEPIKATLKDSNEKAVLLFDCTIITGRTRKELKHLLMHLKASEVYTLSITDRFRLPFEVPNNSRHRSYWRLDVPRLGNSDTCPICKALELVRKFSKELSSEQSMKRIAEWEEKWNVLSYFFPIADHGLKPTPLKQTIEKKFGISQNKKSGKFEQIISEKDLKKGETNLIELKNSLGLALYVTELHAMTSRDDLALKFCQEKDEISAPAKIELMASQLLLFPNEYSKAIQFELVRILFHACNEIREPDNWTALASLVLLIQDRRLHEKLLGEIHREGKTELQLNNYDLKIVFAFIIKYHADQIPLAENISRLLKIKGDETLYNIYTQFHHELYNDSGILHSRPLIAFYNKKEINAAVRISDAVDSISKISYLLGKLPLWRFRKTQLKGSLHDLISQERENLKHFSGLLEKARNGQGEILLQELEGMVKNALIPSLRKIHNLLYCSLVSVDNSTTFVDFMTSLVNSISDVEWRAEAIRKEKELFYTEKPEIAISEDANYIPASMKTRRKNAWIIMDQDLASEFRFTIFNAIHSVQTFEDPWTVDEDDKKRAHMWINIEYFPDHIEFDFVNLSDYDADEIGNSIKAKTKEGLAHLVEDLRGEFKVTNRDVHETGKFVLSIKFILPII